MTTFQTSVSVTTPATVLSRRAGETPNQVALREKDRGLWREVSWSEYWDQVETFAHALIASGVTRGDRVAIQSENRTEWVYTDLGCLAAGAICVGLYSTNPAIEVSYLLANSQSSILVVEDQEQADKVLAIPSSELPDLEKIVYIEHRGVDIIDDPRLISWDEFMEGGRRHREASPDAVRERMESAQGDDPGYMIYTSGTTGRPKGSILNLANIDFCMAEVTSDAIINPGPGPRDLIISYLPLCHIYEKLFSVLIGVGAGVPVHFGESLETLITDMREVQPTTIQGVPRIWERIHAATMVRLASASRLKRFNNAVWMGAARWIGRTLVARGGRHTIPSRLVLGLGNLFLYRSLKERVGLRRVRHAITGAAPIAPEIIEFFMGIGVPLYEAYGMTENGAIATSNRPGRVKLGTVGEAGPNVELKLDLDTGEILVRHAGVFAGYWNNPEATASTIDPDGWLHTGDVGEWVDGTHIRIVDRLKDIIITSGGKNVSPSEIENSLKASPFIKEAIVVGDGRKYLTALIGIDFEVTSEWAQRKSDRPGGPCREEDQREVRPCRADQDVPNDHQRTRSSGW